MPTIKEILLMSWYFVTVAVFVIVVMKDVMPIAEALALLKNVLLVIMNIEESK